LSPETFVFLDFHEMWQNFDENLTSVSGFMAFLYLHFFTGAGIGSRAMASEDRGCVSREKILIRYHFNRTFYSNSQQNLQVEIHST
jgi:hypothetical protein